MEKEAASWSKPPEGSGVPQPGSQGGEASLSLIKGWRQSQSWQDAGRQGQFPRDEARPSMASGAEF